MPYVLLLIFLFALAWYVGWAVIFAKIVLLTAGVVVGSAAIWGAWCGIRSTKPTRPEPEPSSPVDKELETLRKIVGLK